ncbi:sodium:proton antiporter [Stenotrophomonas koreensis]|jgi:Na+/H+ antiporter|uniref:Sodium:proton antiporter n=1 Tax=Stenotrophomonas koreensis TaxID=266128 RepID=A0A0R0C3R9_9GAMM|nr:Na+/H+ antiporter [Stenotrophomonas koreensis]KRG61042.1 sodium:proton antiporter [Stenotrophomonas koreensis]
MHSIEVVLAMLLAVVASGYLVRILPVGLPLPLVQIGLGAAIAGFFGRGHTLDPQLFFLLFLPPLLFLDGWRIPKQGLFRDKGTVIELALGLVLFTVIGAGLLIHWLIPSMPMGVAFALAAILSPTDPVAVSAIAKRAPVPKRLMHILEGESLLNDASGLVCFRFAVAAVMTGVFSLADAALTFVWVALAGLAIGVGVTWGIATAQRWLWRSFGEEPGAALLVNLLTPFAAYLLAEHVHASGILAAVAAGITMSYVELTGRVSGSMRVQRTAVWDTVQFAFNGIIFVLLGEQLPGIVERAVDYMHAHSVHSPWWLLVYVAVINLSLVLLRLLWVWLSMRWSLLKARLRGQQRPVTPWRIVLATSVAGVRGAVTLAGVLTLPLLLPDGSAFPARDLVIFIAAAVILCSLLAASLLLPVVLKGLELPADDSQRHEEDLARRMSSKAALAAVERRRQEMVQGQATGSVQLVNDAAAQVSLLYQRNLSRGQNVDADPEQVARIERDYRQLRNAGLNAEREELFRLARRGRISDELSRKLIRNLDLLESRQRD